MKLPPRINDRYCAEMLAVLLHPSLRRRAPAHRRQTLKPCWCRCVAVSLSTTAVNMQLLAGLRPPAPTQARALAFFFTFHCNAVPLVASSSPLTSAWCSPQVQQVAWRRGGGGGDDEAAAMAVMLEAKAEEAVLAVGRVMTACPCRRCGCKPRVSFQGRG